MNQILVSEKVYVTKEMKRKRKIYKTLYIISVMTIIVLSLYYIISERNKIIQEGLSHEILEKITNDNTIVEERTIVVSLDNNSDDTTIVRSSTIVEERTIVVSLDNNSDDSQVIPIQDITPNTETEPIASEVTASNGQNYESEAVLTIPKLGISYPVLTEENEELLKVSLCKYWGPRPNEVGNYCIVGHNYKSGKMFGKLANAYVGDEVTLEDLSGRTITYSIYDRRVVEPTDVSCTSQLTNGQRELTLITCTDYGKRRLIVKAREI